MTRRKKFSLQRFLDEAKLAAVGVKNAVTRRSFFIPAILGFLIFGTLLSLLSAGSVAFTLMGASDFGGKLQIIGDAFLKLFGVNQTSFLDWAFTFFIALLQGVLIGLVVFVYKSRKDAANLQNAGIVAGLAILGSGCPTCGTTVLMPIIVSIAGSSSMALASTVSWLLTVASVIVAILALKKVGFEAYAIIEDQKFKERHASKQSTASSEYDKITKKETSHARGKSDQRKDSGK